VSAYVEPAVTLTNTAGGLGLGFAATIGGAGSLAVLPLGGAQIALLPTISCHASPSVTIEKSTPALQ